MCGDEGVISGWEQSLFDLRPGSINEVLGDETRAVITPEVAATLRSLMMVDSACERMIFGVTVSDGDVVLRGDLDDVDELVGYIAAEANHEGDRRRQTRLDAAFDVLRDVIEREQPG